MKKSYVIALSIVSLLLTFTVAYVLTKPSEEPTAVASTATEVADPASQDLSDASLSSPEDVLRELDLNSATLGDDILAELSKHMRPLDEYLATFENDPKDQEAINGILFHVNEMAPEAAEVMLRRLSMRAPTEPLFVEHLGWSIFYEQKRYKEAIDFYTPLFEGTKDRNPVVADLLANMHEALEANETAAVYARQAAATGLDPRFELQLGYLELDLSDPVAAKAAFDRGQQKLKEQRQTNEAESLAAGAMHPDELSLIPIEISLGIGEAKIQKDQGQAELAAQTISSLEQRIRGLRTEVGAIVDDHDSGLKNDLASMLDRQEAAVQRTKDRLRL